MRTKVFLLLFFVFCHACAFTQEVSTKNQFKRRKWILTGASLSLWGGSYYALHNSWYANHPSTRFHLYNDWGEWQQMDKAGHVWSAYQIADHASAMWKWAGLSSQQSSIIGSISSMAYLSIIEIMDGRSQKWGFSIPDMLANSTGAMIYLGQELLLKEQPVRIKMSYIPYQYGSLQNRADELFGKSQVEKLLKDYNGQTYWASVNIRSILPSSAFPKWLNVAVGYGAKTMLGGYTNTWIDENGNTIVRDDILRYRKIYLSADIDLTKIKTSNKTLKTVFSLINVLKFPAPAIEFTNQGKINFHPLF